MARLEIHGILFGEPVRHGTLSLRETERPMELPRTEWDIEEGETYEGDTDEQGHYVQSRFGKGP